MNDPSQATEEENPKELLIACGLCGGSGKISEFKEIWPCPSCRGPDNDIN